MSRYQPIPMDEIGAGFSIVIVVTSRDGALTFPSL